MDKNNLKLEDPEVYNILKKEEDRQQNMLSLIASENFTSKAVREAVGSVFMNKYSEGQVGARYYEGNLNIDDLEALAKTRVQKLFNLPRDWSVIVQALSGSPANLAVYNGLLNPGDRIMSMFLYDGGHLSHGWSYTPKEKFDSKDDVYEGGKKKISIVSKIFDVVQYKTDPKTQLFNYERIEEIAQKFKPKMIITGGTAYPRDIDYKRIQDIADSVGSLYLADIAHEAGLIGAGALSSPVGIADIVTFTTHKTLRCNRGAVIMGKEELMKSVEKSLFPGIQGGPHNHSIAGIAVGVKEAMSDSFKEYAKNIIENAKHMAKGLKKKGFDIVSGGTDKHLVLIDLGSKGVYGKKFARALYFSGIVANMNSVPGETRSPANPSGLRLGTPWITTRGMGKKEVESIVDYMNQVMEHIKGAEDMEFSEFEEKFKKDEKLLDIRKSVEVLCKKFPLEI